MPSYQAPAVRFGVKRSRALSWGGCALAAAGAAGLLLWAASGAPKPIVGLAGVALLWLGCVSVALRFVACMPQGDLAWDGVSWRFEAGGCPSVTGALRVHMDGQSRLLVSLHGKGQPDHWLWLERRMHPERWADLRRAVYSRARPDAGQGSSTASADRGQA